MERSRRASYHWPHQECVRCVRQPLRRTRQALLIALPAVGRELLGRQMWTAFLGARWRWRLSLLVHRGLYHACRAEAWDGNCPRMENDRGGPLFAGHSRAATSGGVSRRTLERLQGGDRNIGGRLDLQRPAAFHAQGAVLSVAQGNPIGGMRDIGEFWEVPAGTEPTDSTVRTGPAADYFFHFSHILPLDVLPYFGRTLNLCTCE